MARVLIVEDESIIAKELAFNLQDHGYEVVGVASSYEGALMILENRKIDIALLDIAIKGSRNGLELGEFLKDKFDIPFIVLSAFYDDDAIEKATSAGAEGYIVNPFKKRDLKPVIELALSKALSRKRNIPSLEEINNHSDNKITKSEYQVISKICEGKMNADIAVEMNVTINTVKKHTNNIYRKLKVNRKPMLINYVQNILKSL